jgi:hypothetical protein
MYDPAVTSNFSSALQGAGQIQLMRLHIPAATNVTGITVYLANGGAGLVAGQCWAALFDAATGNLIGVTADQATNWASAGAKRMDLTGGPFARPVGDVYAGLVFNGTTSPNVTRQAAGAPALININLGTGSTYRYGLTTATYTTAPPSTLGVRGIGFHSFWAALH